MNIADWSTVELAVLRGCLFVPVQLFCNDSDGSPTGQVLRVMVGHEVAGDHITVESPWLYRGVRCWFPDDAHVKLGRRLFQHYGDTNWFGHQACHMVRLRQQDATAVLEMLRGRGWQCDSATTEPWRWWHRLDEHAEVPA